MSHTPERCGRCGRSIDLLKRQVLCVPCQRDLLQACVAGRVAVAPGRPDYTIQADPVAYVGCVDVRGSFGFKPGELGGIVEPWQFEWLG